MTQVRPTIDLLTRLDELHPDILLQHAIQPADYRGGLVFRSAVESIRGSFAASSRGVREGFVQAVLEALLRQDRIAQYEHTGSRQRYDFTIGIERDPDYFAALEVKGGEGNSINISERPMWAREFGLWCHLDGAIVNQPFHGAHAIVNRLVNEFRRHKHVDMVFFKDVLCGTRLRPCPKYAFSEQQNGSIAPDILLFPQRIPTVEEPEPPVHTLDTLRLPRMILELFGIYGEDQQKHVWRVLIKLDQRYEWQIVHQGTIVDSSKSRLRGL